MLAKAWAWWVPVLLLGAWCDVAGAVPTEPIARLVHEKRHGEAQRTIETRLARDASDPAALAALVDLRIAHGGPDDLLQARAAAERCALAIRIAAGAPKRWAMPWRRSRTPAACSITCAMRAPPATLSSARCAS